MEEVDKGCSKFCITVVSTAISTAGILIYSQLMALTVDFSRLSGVPSVL